MRKILIITLIVSVLITLSSCFLFGRATTHPDMVEYTETEVLSVAKEKYSVTEWIFTGTEIRGEAGYDAEGAFCLEFYEGQFGTEFANGDNIEAAMQAFAGKNGNHDIQGMYSRFLCCIALGRCADASLKFVYYNTNIHKDAEIADTIGASDYTFDVSPAEIKHDLFTVDSRWTDMQRFLNDFKDAHPRGFVYSGERLTIRRSETTYSYVEFEFYKENGAVVYDVYYTKDEKNPEKRRLVYSTSDRYGVIYNYYGADKTQYFNITQTVTQSPDESGVMELWGYVEAKPIDGTVLYSDIGYSAKYQVLRDGKTIEHNSSDNAYDTLNFKRGYGIDKIDGVDHTETAKFTVSDYYVFYEKNLDYPGLPDISEDPMKGIEVYCWQDGGEWKCGGTLGTNRQKFDEEIRALQVVTIPEMKRILEQKGLTDCFVVIPVDPSGETVVYLDVEEHAIEIATLEIQLGRE